VAVQFRKIGNRDRDTASLGHRVSSVVRVRTAGLLTQLRRSAINVYHNTTADT
jgi:hypothetical protein